MRIAVISDVHGNIEALTNALKDIELQAVDKIISLGDNIGYGADSEAVIQQMIASKIPSILGNHELACVNKKVYKSYIGDVKTSLDDTLSKLSSSSVDYLKGLTVNLSQYHAFFVHGFWPKIKINSDLYKSSKVTEPFPIPTVSESPAPLDS